MIDVSFDRSPWEAYLASCTGSKVSAANLLAMLEKDDEDAMEDAFQLIEEKHMTVELSSLSLPEPEGKMALRLEQEAEYVRNGLRLSDMEENDPLRLYLAELAEIPKTGDEEALIRRYRDGDDAAGEELTNLGLHRVVELSKAYLGKNVFLMDLIQDGNIGLWQAIQSFEEGDYPAFRDRMVNNAMAKTILIQAKNSGIGRRMRESMQSYRASDRRLLQELGRNPSLEEIAQDMQVSREAAEAVKKMMEDAFLLKQAESYGQPEEDPEEDAAVEDTAYFQMRQRIGELLTKLNEQDARILTLRFGLENGRPLSPEETGRALGITTGEVTRREVTALAILRS